MKTEVAKVVKVVIIGPEASGNRWLKSILQGHEGIEISFAGSFPKFLYHARCYPDLQPYNDGQTILLVVGRDQTITQKSNDRFNRNDQVENPERFSFANTLEEIRGRIREWTGKTIFVSYELLLLWQNDYLKKIFEDIGVDTTYNYDLVEYLDGNKKYIKEDNNDEN
jgi:hypothetical protein